MYTSLNGCKQNLEAEQSYSEAAGPVSCLYEIARRFAALGGRQLVAAVPALKTSTEARVFLEAS
jgi:hypothetical protein